MCNCQSVRKSGLKLFLYVLLLGLFSFFVFTKTAVAENQSTEELIKGAKQEGEIVILGTTDIITQNNVLAKFQEKYPFLKGKTYKVDSERLLTKILTEARAGKLSADVLQTNAIGLHVFKKGGALGYYLSPENHFYANQFKDEGYWTTANINIHVIAYNTKKVTRKDLPESYEDLLKPLWKRRMMMELRAQWFANMLQIMGREKGLYYMRELSKQDIAIRSVSSAMRAQLLIAGEADLDITTTFTNVEEVRKKGGPINWTTLGPVPAILVGYGISASPQHPNAAKLFVDFVLSKEGQKMFVDSGKVVVRSDLFQEQKLFKNLQLVPLDPSLGEHFDDYAKQMREIFKKK